VSEVLSVDPIWKLDLIVLAERKKFNQEVAANAAQFSSVGLLLVCQEQNWNKDIEMGNEGSVMLLQIPHFMG